MSASYPEAEGRGVNRSLALFGSINYIHTLSGTVYFNKVDTQAVSSPWKNKQDDLAENGGPELFLDARPAPQSTSGPMILRMTQKYHRSLSRNAEADEHLRTEARSRASGEPALLGCEFGEFGNV